MIGKKLFTGNGKKIKMYKILTVECFDKNNQILGVVDEVWRP